MALAGNRILVAAGEQGLLVYELDRSLYPPLKPPVITNGMMIFTWPALEGVRLQKSTNLVTWSWVDVPGLDGTNFVIVPGTEPSAFYRLAMGPKTTLPPPGLIAWWDGDSVAGNTAHDLTGRNDAIMAGGVTLAPGMVGQGFLFDGDGDYMTASTVGLPAGGNPISYVLWVNPGTRNLDDSRLVQYGNWNCGKGFNLHKPKPIPRRLLVLPVL